MSSPKKPETPVRIESESTFREKVGLTGSPIALEWKKDQVLETTEGALTQLRDELSGKESADEKRKTAEEFLRSQEQSEASESIEDKLEKAISSGVTDKLKASGIAVGVAAGATAVVHQLDSQIEKTTGVKVGLKESLREWFKEAMNDNTFYLGFLWKALYHAFGGKDNVASQPQQEETGVSLSEHEKAFGQRGAKKVYEKLENRGIIQDNKIQSYFTHASILSQSTTELELLYNEGKTDTKKMAEKLGFNPDEGTILHQAIGYLLSKETKELMKGFDIKNAENVPIGRLFSSVTKYLDLLDNVKKKGKDLNISDMSFRDSISLEGAKEFIGDKKIILEDIKSRYAGFSPTVLHTIHYGYSSRSIDEKVDFKAHEKTLNEDEKKFVTETLPNFGKNLPAMVRSFSFGSPEASEAIEQFLNNNKLRYDDLIDIFVLSGGHASIDDMNAFEKSQVLVRIFLMIRKANGSEGYKFAGSIFQGIFSSDTKIKIPVEVKMVLSDFGDIFKEAMVITLKETRDMAFGIAKANPWFATGVGATVVGVLWLAIQLTPVGRVASTFMWLLTALGLGGVLTAYTMSSDGKLKDYSGKVVADVEKIADEHRKPKA